MITDSDDYGISGEWRSNDDVPRKGISQILDEIKPFCSPSATVVTSTEGKWIPSNHIVWHPEMGLSKNFRFAN